ncbi:MAG: response regulator, partial [Chloroflexi bacterium]|nr:response regulator [Chloroflexota bacterium]
TVRLADRVILEAGDGDEAWQLLQEHRPDLAVLDIQMPGRTGLELTRAIRNDPRLATMPVILLTARARSSDVEAGLAAGANLYLTKPFSPLQLMQAIDQIVAQQSAK